MNKKPGNAHTRVHAHTHTHTHTHAHTWNQTHIDIYDRQSGGHTVQQI